MSGTKRHPRVITWDRFGGGTAPDGTKYVLQVEGDRHEGRAWSAMVWDDGLRDVPSITPPQVWPTRDRAKQDAEAHYRAKIAKETT